MADAQAVRYFRRRNGGIVKIGADALATMTDFVQVSDVAPEAGGVLIGRHIVGSNDVVIDRVTTPMAGDRRSRYRFFRSQRAHQAILDEVWRSSGGTVVYIGEWHTHPEPVPTPSGIDMDDWRRRLQRDYVEAPFQLFMIVGQDAIRAWEGSRTSFGISPLQARRESSK